MSEEKSAKVKVAVLGGGVGALSAALALTDPARKQNCEVTVYTMGWRLGGKGASGRNPAFGQRIEEHGIHVWFGFYDNAFRLLDGCYRELADKGWLTPEGRPVSIDRCIGEAPNSGAAFYPHDSFVVNEQRTADGPWSMWRLKVPRNEQVPGDGKPVPPEASLAYAKLAEMLESIADIRSQGAREGLAVPLPPLLPAPVPAPETAEETQFRRFAEARAPGVLEGVVTLTPEEYIRNALDGLAAPALDEALALPQEGLFDAEGRFRLRLRFVAWALRGARQLLRGWDGFSDRAHRLYLSCDTFAAIATGLSRDVFTAGDTAENMRQLDELEFRTWLARNGADPDYLLSNPTVRFIYNSAFAFQDGDHELPSIAAGSALRGVLRLFLTYKGAFAYRMSAGMGDVVFAPIYELLRRRGVKFNFFHRVDGLTVADAPDVNGRPVVDSIQLTEQVRLARGTYDPLVWVKDFPCWPSQPRFEQLANGAEWEKAAASATLNLEDPSATSRDATSRVLKRHADFDQVVLGIPVAALPELAGPLRAHEQIGPAWRNMLDKTATTPTQGFQLWFRAGLQDLGWHDPAPVFGTYVEPIDTYIDMTPALALEERRQDDIKNLSYFCGVFERRAGESHGDAMNRAVDNAIRHLVERCSYIWPALGTGNDFDWSLLWGTKPGLSARDNFLAGQFARANVLPSELYTLNLPGTARYRIRPDAAARPEEGPSCANLWLAGDWTHNPINLGCVEATVMSGLAAARGLTGETLEIVGEDDAYLWQSIGAGKATLSRLEMLPVAGQAVAVAAPPPSYDEVLARLQQAVATFDRPGVEALCQAFKGRVAGDGPLPTIDVAERVLSTLRRKRHFDLMETVADALLQAGVESPGIRRQYSQALIEQDKLTLALAMLRDIAADSNANLDERAEGLGLVGRVYKQRYVKAPGGPRATESLRAAIDSYHGGYIMNRANRGWHAVNAVALLDRARRDGIGMPPQGALATLDAHQLARAALATVNDKARKKLEGFDYAIAAEASLALGDHGEAIASFKEYVARVKLADAFDIAATLRQLQEVWQLPLDREPGATIIPLLQAELLDRQGGRLDLPASQIQNARANLQRLLGTETAVSLKWFRTGLDRCRLVARVTDQNEQGGGTGFLVRAGDVLPCDFPNELVLLTNAHVLDRLSTDPGTLSPHNALIRFEAARESSEPPPIHRVREILWSSLALDTTVARLDPAPSGLVGCPFAAAAPAPGARVYVIGHPLGGGMSLSLYDNLLLERNDTFVHYRAPTEPGSSGSPVFDGQWNLVALHHAGGLAMPHLNGAQGLYAANEGIWFEAIRRGTKWVPPQVPSPAQRLRPQ